MFRFTEPSSGKFLKQGISLISLITGPKCPEGSRKLRFPDYMTIAHVVGKVISLTRRPLFTPRI